MNNNMNENIEVFILNQSDNHELSIEALLNSDVEIECEENVEEIIVDESQIQYLHPVSTSINSQKYVTDHHELSIESLLNSDVEIECSKNVKEIIIDESQEQYLNPVATNTNNQKNVTASYIKHCRLCLYRIDTRNEINHIKLFGMDRCSEAEELRDKIYYIFNRLHFDIWEDLVVCNKCIRLTKLTFSFVKRVWDNETYLINNKVCKLSDVNISTYVDEGVKDKATQINIENSENVPITFLRNGHSLQEIMGTLKTIASDSYKNTELLQNIIKKNESKEKSTQTTVQTQEKHTNTINPIRENVDNRKKSKVRNDKTRFFTTYYQRKAKQLVANRVKNDLLKEKDSVEIMESDCNFDKERLRNEVTVMVEKDYNFKNKELEEYLAKRKKLMMKTIDNLGKDNKSCINNSKENTTENVIDVIDHNTNQNKKPRESVQQTKDKLCKKSRFSSLEDFLSIRRDFIKNYLESKSGLRENNDAIKTKSIIAPLEVIQNNENVGKSSLTPSTNMTQPLLIPITSPKNKITPVSFITNGMNQTISNTASPIVIQDGYNGKVSVLTPVTLPKIVAKAVKPLATRIPPMNNAKSMLIPISLPSSDLITANSITPLKALDNCTDIRNSNNIPNQTAINLLMDIGIQNPDIQPENVEGITQNEIQIGNVEHTPGEPLHKTPAYDVLFKPKRKLPPLPKTFDLFDHYHDEYFDAFQGRAGCFIIRKYKNFYKRLQRNESLLCEKCGYCAKKKQSYFNHMSMHKGDRCNMCYICGKMLYYGSLNHHIIMKHSLPVHKCGQCGRKFHLKKSLEKHVSYIHSAEQIWCQCQVCGKMLKPTSIKGHLREHRKTNEDYKCNICQKTFKMKWTLTRHRFRHFVPFKYSCPYCARKMKYEKMYKHHIRTFHEGNPDYKCSICHKPFARKKVWQEHMRRRHSPSQEIRKQRKQSVNRYAREMEPVPEEAHEIIQNEYGVVEEIVQEVEMIPNVQHSYDEEYNTIHENIQHSYDEYNTIHENVQYSYDDKHKSYENVEYNSDDNDEQLVTSESGFKIIRDTYDIDE